MLWVAGEGGREGVDLDLVECGPIESSGSRKLPTCVCFVSNGISLDYWQGHV